MTTVTEAAVGSGAPGATEAPRATSLSPNRRAWARFKRNRLGYVSLILFAAMLVVGTFAEMFSNERPLVARFDGAAGTSRW